MKKVIDVNNLIERAKKARISVYILVKREIRYRKQSEREKLLKENCYNCKLCELINFGITRSQCSLIGFNNCVYADVDNEHLCNFYAKDLGKKIKKAQVGINLYRKDE